MAEPRTSTSLPLAEREEGYEHLWYSRGLRFACAGCGHCCSGGPGYVWVTDADITRIAAFLSISVEAFGKRYLRHVSGALSLTEKPGYDCIFLDRQGGKTLCKIYDVRPMQCRTWPFWNQNLKSPQAWTDSASRCPGMCDAGAPVHPVEHIEEKRRHPESPD